MMPYLLAKKSGSVIRVKTMRCFPCLGALLVYFKELNPRWPDRWFVWNVTGDGEPVLEDNWRPDPEDLDRHADPREKQDE